MELSEILAHLETAFMELAAMRGNLDNGMRPDTAFALGEALGAVHQAKRLVERDIEAKR